jgi:hypothetical protein
VKRAGDASLAAAILLDACVDEEGAALLRREGVVRSEPLEARSSLRQELVDSLPLGHSSPPSPFPSFYPSATAVTT